MRQSRYFVFIFMLALSGYAHARDAGAHALKSAPATNTFTCPSQLFSEFLNAFTENKEVQMAFTRYPLQQQQLDLNAEPEPRPVIRMLSRAQIIFPVIPGEAERKAGSLSIRVDELTSNRAKLTLVKGGTDYQISYFFSKNLCWQLERIEDWSL